MLSSKEIEAMKENRKMRIIAEAETSGLKIGLTVIKNYHPRGCDCVDCLTIPKPFYTHPGIHKEFVDCIFKAVKG